MNYVPRYTYWLFKLNVEQIAVPVHLTELIEQFERCLNLWHKEQKAKQATFHAALLQTDAFISAELYRLFESHANPKSEEDHIQALLKRAAELDF